MRITDLRCALIGDSPVVRILTDAGIDGYSQVETWKPFLVPNILGLRELLVGCDPTDVERCMTRIRHRGGFKPWGAAVSSVEIALWDIAGKASGLPVHKLMGGKVRDRIRVYNGARREPMEGWTPEHYAKNTRAMLEADEGFTIVKQPIGFHSDMCRDVEDFFYGDPLPDWQQGLHDRGLLTPPAMDLMIDCVAAMRDVLGSSVGLALDCGPGWSLPDAIRFADAVAPYQPIWLEDLLTGDYSPHDATEQYRDLTLATKTPIHTGEQIYLRQNFRRMIETRAVNVIGPDPGDIGGLSELKWVAELADLHGVLIAPHGTANGVLGLGALIQVSATLPRNFIAFEYPVATQPWWYDIVEGLPERIVVDGHVPVLDRPGIGIDLIPQAAKAYLRPTDSGFFD
ncbi:mandelate racemase/muconate lactonizing enzyme family protein [Celeribacter sp.]|uniref:mandelate racemase/muconate lactonizing enzyme family protein n=1 Tax=Celeribacter sp. TaxID=1890673 RepID=UPI003A92F0D4